MKLLVISLSGGLDSATLAAKAIEEGYSVLALNYNYGQKNSCEQLAFEYIFEFLSGKAESKNLLCIKKHIDLTNISKDMFDMYRTLRDNHEIKEHTSHEFYTPMRNLLFTVISGMIGEIWAYNNNIEEVHIGLGVHKHSEEAYGEHKDYWDITPEFVERLNKVFELNDSKKVQIYAPFVNMTKTDIVKECIKLNVPYKLTWTCYNPKTILISNKKIYEPCNQCEACIERKNAGKNADIFDINDYVIIENKYNSFLTFFNNLKEKVINKIFNKKNR